MSAACAVLTRNAENRIGHWIMWHLALGFERVLVFDTGSTDQTRAIVRALSNVLPVELRPAEHWQGPADTRRLMITREAMAAADDLNWLLVLDLDEYLDPGESLPALLARAPETADAIALNWSIFGSNGHETPAYGPVMLSYDHRAPEAFPDHGYTRLFVRIDRLATVADAHFYTLERWRIHDPSGNPIDWAAESAPVNWADGRILHYICSTGRTAPAQTDALWQHYDRNDVPDDAVHRHLPAFFALEGQVHTRLLSHAVTIFNERHAERPPQPRPPERDNRVPDTRESPVLRYHRVFPSDTERALLNAPCTVATSQPQPCLVRDAGGRFLGVTPSTRVAFDAGEPAGNRTASGWPLVVALAYPGGLLLLTSATSGPVSVGDIPCIDGHAALRAVTEPGRPVVSLPVQAGLGTGPLDLVPIALSTPAPPLPVPGIDTPDGLSLEGLYLWSSRISRSAQEVQRALGLLSPDAASALRRDHPELAGFLARAD